jgi:hypothetical protein
MPFLIHLLRSHLRRSIGLPSYSSYLGFEDLLANYVIMKNAQRHPQLKLVVPLPK